MFSFKGICYEIYPKVNGEILMNLLEHMLTLFGRLFSLFRLQRIFEKSRSLQKKTKKQESVYCQLK